MIKLLCRLYDPTEGEITLNGIDIRKYDQARYREILCVVFQDFQLFGYALGHNVACRADYDGPRAREALSRAGFGDRLDTLPEGLDTPLYKEYDDRGVEISAAKRKNRPRPGAL
jgi:ATP-binding cassette subfamily B protein